MKISENARSTIVASAAALLSAIAVSMLIVFAIQPQIYDLFFLASLAGILLIILLASAFIILLVFIPINFWIKDSSIKGWLTVAAGCFSWTALFVGVGYASAGNIGKGDIFYLASAATIGLFSGLSFAIMSKMFSARKA